MKSLQILVFQEGLASRTFQVPLRWFTQLGWILGASILIAALALGAAISIWRSSHQARPERLRELEQQIQAFQAKLSAKARETSTPPSAPTAPLGTPSLIGFSAFPTSIKGQIPLVARPSVPIEMTAPQIQWAGKKLKVGFDIRYVGQEGRNQQGRIIVAARGPETLMVYPTGALQSAESGSLFDPERGEYFSVSRFRETRLAFPSVDSPIRTLEIFLIGTDAIDQENKILIHETYPVPPTQGGSRAAE
ncbi:MAG: hypothetical protein ACK5QT_05025 [Oligoflexia bacterium]|jgi:hypothetical protein